MSKKRVLSISIDGQFEQELRNGWHSDQIKKNPQESFSAYLIRLIKLGLRAKKQGYPFI